MSTAAHRLPKRDSNGSTSVVNSRARIRRAKNRPPSTRLRPKHKPPCTPDAIPELEGPLDGTQQVSAVHPRRRHGEDGEPERHGAAGHEQLARGPAPGPPGGSDANPEEDGVQAEDGEHGHRTAQRSCQRKTENGKRKQKGGAPAPPHRFEFSVFSFPFY